MKRDVLLIDAKNNNVVFSFPLSSLYSNVSICPNYFLFLFNFFCPCCFLNYFKTFFLLQFSLILSPPLAPPLQLSVQRVCLQAQTTAPLSSLWLAVAAATRNTTSPKASPSLPSAHRTTPSLPLLLPQLSISVSLLQAPPLLQSQQMPAQLQPLHRPVATQGPRLLDLHHHDPATPAHWPQRPPSHKTR